VSSGFGNDNSKVFSRTSQVVLSRWIGNLANNFGIRSATPKLMLVEDAVISTVTMRYIIADKNEIESAKVRGTSNTP
jgi:hypothetical protein